MSHSLVDTQHSLSTHPINTPPNTSYQAVLTHPLVPMIVVVMTAREGLRHQESLHTLPALALQVLTH